MLFSTAQQGAVFIWMTAAGLLMGLVYALFDMLRRALHPGIGVSILLDMLMGLCCAGVFVLALVTGNYGRLRLFEILAAGLGFALFELGVQAPMTILLRSMRRRLVQIKANLYKNRLIKALFR